MQDEFEMRQFFGLLETPKDQPIRVIFYYPEIDDKPSYFDGIPLILMQP